MTVGGVTVLGRRIFILKETAATVERRRPFPGLLGTNILEHLLKFTELLKKGMEHRKPKSSTDEANVCRLQAVRL